MKKKTIKLFLKDNKIFFKITALNRSWKKFVKKLIIILWINGKVWHKFGNLIDKSKNSFVSGIE